MIKRMESETLKLTLVTADRVAINFEENIPNGRSPREIILTVDELNDLRNMAEHFWSANNLYTQTSEAKADRERWEVERNTTDLALTPIGRIR